MAGISKRKIIGKYIVPVFALLILLGITLAAVLYSAGVYDFVFIERPEE